MSDDADRPERDDDTGVEIDSDDPTESETDEQTPVDERRADRTFASRLGERAVEFVGSVHPAAWLTLTGAVLFTVVFARLGIQRHRTFGTWAFDLGIYDQGFWLV